VAVGAGIGRLPPRRTGGPVSVDVVAGAFKIRGGAAGVGVTATRGREVVSPCPYAPTTNVPKRSEIAARFFIAKTVSEQDFRLWGKLRFD
jgi:hypothetical protein